MPLIELKTKIKASIEICLNLSRSIDLHIYSTKHTGETAVDGVTSGLIGLGESVTWRAKHFSIWQKLTSKIAAYERPCFFVDEMVKGAFKSFKHEHHFKAEDDKTIMLDHFYFESPLGLFGAMANVLFLERYMKALLYERNKVIQLTAESEEWKRFLPGHV